MSLREQLIVDLERARHGFGAVEVTRLAGAVTLAPLRLTNSACGDEVTVEVTVSRQSAAAGNSRITGLRWSGHGCTVSQASASALAAVLSGVAGLPKIAAGLPGIAAGLPGIHVGLPGIAAGDFAVLRMRFEVLVRGEGTTEPAADLSQLADLDQLDALDALSLATGLGPAVAFAGIGRLPLRAGCALLAWRAVAQAVELSVEAEAEAEAEAENP